MIDIYKDIEKQTKAFVMEWLNDVKLHPEDVNKICPIAYGAIMFSVNHLFPCYNQKLEDWWNNEILPQFREIGA